MWVWVWVWVWVGVGVWVCARDECSLLIMIVLGESLLGQVLADRAQTVEFLFHVVRYVMSPPHPCT